MFDVSGSPVHFGLQLTTDAAVEPITLVEAKSWERIGSTEDEADLAVLIKAARKKVEADTGRVLITSTYTLTLDAVPVGGVITLPIAPVSAISSITAYAPDDTAMVVSSSVYRLDTGATPARIVLREGQSWPSDLRSTSALAIVCVAGYGSAASAIPETNLLLAMRLLIEHWYTNRSAVAVGSISSIEVALGYQALIAPSKVWGVA